jgi:hypothetical protein
MSVDSHATSHLLIIIFIISMVTVVIVSSSSLNDNIRRYVNDYNKRMDPNTFRMNLGKRFDNKNNQPTADDYFFDDNNKRVDPRSFPIGLGKK